MGESRKILLLFLFQLFPVIPAEYAFARVGELDSYEYLSPIPFSLGHNPETVIIIRFGEKIDINSVHDDLFEVTGTISGKLKGKFTVSQDFRTLIFKPVRIFSYDEKVYLHLREGILTQSGKYLPSFSSWFTIIKEPINGSFSVLSENAKERPAVFPERSGYKTSSKGTSISFLDFRLPEITIKGQPSEGNILTTLLEGSKNYLYVFNNKANPVYVRIMPHSVTNLKPHPTGEITYYDYYVKGFIVLDSSLKVVDTLVMKNGYRTDGHEILLPENGHVLMFSYDPKIVDMSTIAEGGNPFATVTGLVIQELDENKNLIFQWRSWDYFKITDSYYDLLSSVINYVHANSLDADTDTTLIISSRNMNEVTKINRLTGKIIWRLGGKQNEFVFENDPRKFAGQHTAIMQKNSSLTLFDNGVGLEPMFSRGVEYKIDELNKKVKLIHEYRHIPDVYANVSGNLQRLDNENTLIFWGPGNDQSGKIISEFNLSGDAIFKASFDGNIFPAYRAYRSLWEPKSFTLSTDSLFVESVIQNATVFRTFKIRNNSDRRIIITSAYHKNLGFYVQDLPVAVEAGSEASFTVAFPSYSPGKLSDNIIFCQETDSTIVTRSLFVSVDNSLGTGIEDLLQCAIKVRPNPGKGEFYIEVTGTGSFSLRVIDLSGKTIWDANGAGIEFYLIDLRSKPEGLYLLHMEETDKGIVQTMKLFKID